MFLRSAVRSSPRRCVPVPLQLLPRNATATPGQGAPSAEGYVTLHTPEKDMPLLLSPPRALAVAGLGRCGAAHTRRARHCPRYALEDRHHNASSRSTSPLPPPPSSLASASGSHPTNSLGGFPSVTGMRHGARHAPEAGTQPEVVLLATPTSRQAARVLPLHSMVTIELHGGGGSILGRRRPWRRGEHGDAGAG